MVGFDFPQVRCCSQSQPVTVCERKFLLSSPPLLPSSAPVLSDKPKQYKPHQLYVGSVFDVVNNSYIKQHSSYSWDSIENVTFSPLTDVALSPSHGSPTSTSCGQLHTFYNTKVSENCYDTSKEPLENISTPEFDYSVTRDNDDFDQTIKNEMSDFKCSVSKASEVYLMQKKIVENIASDENPLTIQPLLSGIDTFKIQNIVSECSNKSDRLCDISDKDQELLELEFKAKKESHSTQGHETQESHNDKQSGVTVTADVVCSISPQNVPLSNRKVGIDVSNLAVTSVTVIEMSGKMKNQIKCSQTHAETTEVCIGSDEEIPCSQYLGIASEIAPQHHLNDKVEGLLNIDDDEDKLDFSPLYNQRCYEYGEAKLVAPSANAGHFLLTSNTMRFSPLISDYSTVVSKSPLQNEERTTNMQDLSPNPKIDSNSKSKSHMSLLSFGLNIHSDTDTHDGERNASNDETFYKKHNNNSNDDMNDSDSLIDDDNRSSASDNLNSSDELPELKVFSPLSTAKIKIEREMNSTSYEEETKETNAKQNMHEKEEINHVMNQIVPEVNIKCEERSHGNKTAKVREICENPDVKSYMNENHDECEEQSTFIKQCSPGHSGHNERNQFRKETSFGKVKDSEVDGNEELFQDADICIKTHGSQAKVEKSADNYYWHHSKYNLNDIEMHAVAKETDDNNMQGILRGEQVVPGENPNKEDNRLEESSFFYEKNKSSEAEKKTVMMEPHLSAFHWTSVYESDDQMSKVQCPTGHLESIVPLPSPLKRARPLRIGLSKKQKVRHLHEK